MQVEYYEPTESDNRRYEAFVSTRAGQLARERNHDRMYKALEWRMEHQGFVPSPEVMKTYEEWKASKRRKS